MWKRYLAFVMTIMLVLQTAPTAVYAGERTGIGQNSINTVESGEKPENGEKTETSDQTEQTDGKQDSESEPIQSEDDNLEENSGEETTSPEGNAGQENPEDSTEEEQPVENPVEEGESGSDQPEENADEEQLDTEETVEEPTETESDTLTSVYATGSTGEYQPEGVSYKLTYTEVTGGVKITGITGTKEGELKIPEQIDGMDVVEIGNSAFADCNRLTGELVIPNNVTKIGDRAFFRCWRLKGELKLHNNITAIGTAAFYECKNLTGELVIPESINVISDATFGNCKGIGNVKINKRIEQLGKNAFSDDFDNGIRKKIFVYNNDLVIGSEGLGKRNVIYGYSESTAEEYVKEHSTSIFVSLNDPPKVEEYRVSNTEELVNKLGSHRKIILADGVYDLGEYDLYGPRKYLKIANLVDLKIEAEHTGKAEILSHDKISPVIEIAGSVGISISGCILGHDSVEDGEGCGEEGYVVRSVHSSDIRVENCDLYGCGIWGIYTSTSEVTVEKSIVRDCMNGILLDYEYGGTTLEDCILSGNAYSDMQGKYQAFSMNCTLSVINCVFLNNYSQSFGYERNKAIENDCSFYNNVWDGGTPQSSGICLNGITWQIDDNVLKLGYPLELDNGTIQSQTGKVLDYSASAAPWKNYKFSEVQYAEGVEKPDEEIVGSINLDKETLTLSIDETAILNVEITPDSAAETPVAWTSSDTTVAEVEDGLVTAVYAGECTITATVGNKSATCLVTVTDWQANDDIVSGKYGNVTWSIDTKGKLTVNGEGGFAPTVISDYYDTIHSTRAPWYEYRDQIISAEIDVKNIYDASYMFYGCINLVDVDLHHFDTSRAINMYGMFMDCENLKTLDLSSLDTGQVHHMGSMFSGCNRLTDLKLGDFDTGQATDMNSMFSSCSSLTKLDLSSFDVSNVSTMDSMFWECSTLVDLNLNNFNTSNQLMYIADMFSGCSSLVEIDLSSFDGSGVCDFLSFYGDDNTFSMFENCNNLTTIYTPYNLMGYYQLPVDLGDIWYQPDGSEITKLPTGCDSMMIAKNKVPDACNPYIKATIRKINYVCGDFIATRGLTVKYYDSDGTIKKVTDYTTNEDEIDMSTPGKKTFVITYNGLSTEIELNVSIPQVERITLNKNSLTLSKGEITTLHAEILPANALSLPITWVSSDPSIAKVIDGQINDGYVTAVSAGECTIKATVGDKSATCLVTVTDGQADDDIAGGSYENVRWKIDVNGNLTVEGSGDFAGSNSTDRAPWFERRSAIKSAEVNLTGTTNAAYMFYDCQNVTDIDMCRFDVENVTSFTGFLDSCPELSTIHVPCHLKESVVLPESDPLNIWCDTEGNTYTELPKNLDHSIVLTRTQKPVTTEPYITLNKVKTSYIVGEQLNTDDLEVTYYDETGAPSKVSGYTTNVDEIDMSTPGTKMLVVTYQNLTAEIEITVSERQPDEERGLKILFKNEQDQEVAYTGSAMKPELKVSYNGRPLIEGTNYTVKYSNNVKVGNAKISVTGKGNFKSSKTENFRIVQADIANAEFAGTDPEGRLVVVQGSKFVPAIYCGSHKLNTNDYILSGMIQAGKTITDGDSGKVITIKGKGNYTGNKEIALNVVSKNNLTKFTVTIDATKLNALIYDGREHYIHDIEGALKVTGKDGNTNMKRGIDYMVMYPDNVTDAGTKKISVVGMGLYTGTVSKSYTIKPAVNTSGSVRVEYESGNIESIKLPYRSTGVTFNDQLKVTYTKDGNTLLLTEGKDYKVSYSGNKKVGNEAKFTISFLGNYKGIKKQIRMFTIEKADLGNASVVIADAVYKRTPGIYKSVPYLIEPETGRLINVSNYKVSYFIDETRNIEMKGKNKVSSGDTVYVKIEAKANGNYKSDTPIIKTYQVADAMNLSNVKISFINAKTEYATKTAEYTGNKITDREIKVLINGKLADENVVITYANNIAKGKATVIITGTGKPGCKYTGCKKANFNIVAYSLR